MELRHLAHFVAVAEERNFTRAARRLHLVQSALSVSIRSLEHELDTPLFERTTREVRLTDAGRTLLPEAHRTLDAAADAQAAVLGAREGLRGTLRLGMMQVVSSGFDVSSLIARFHRERPLVEISPKTAAPGGSAALIADVRRGALDATFAVITGSDMPGLTATTLTCEPVLLGCPPEHPLARRAAVSLSELAGEPFVDYAPGWATRTIADQLFTQAGIERSIGIEVADGSIHATLVRAGLGLAILPQSIITYAGLAAVPLRPAATFTVAFITTAERQPSPVTRAFAQLVAVTVHP
jgi:DNA-binding transcriptional LysR family regulator